MANNPNNPNPDIENLKDDLAAARSIASDTGQALSEAFKKGNDQVKELGKTLKSSLLTFGKIDSTLQGTSTVLDKMAKKEISRKEAAKEVNKLRSLESKIQSEIEKIEQTKATLSGKALKKANELQNALREQKETTTKSREEFDKTLKNYKDGIGVIGDLAGSFGELGKIQGILGGAFKFMIDAAFKIDNQVTKLSKSLGVSKDSAREMRNSFFEYAKASGDTFLTAERLLKAQQGLTDQLGIAVKFSGEEAEQFARLTEQIGLSNEEAGKLAQVSAATGVSTKDYVASLRNGAFEMMKTKKIRLEDKEILSTISKLSAGILVKFQKNPEALAKAVVQAKALGLSLEQVDKVGESMLDFESSIEKELEAELITGKQLNFERARAAALSGDQATLMEEIASQAGSLAEFSQMNVVAQNSLAQAFGMNREEMADMLVKQEAINKYGDEAAKLNAEQLEYMEKHGLSAAEMIDKIETQRSTQEQFNDAMLKMQEILGQLLSEDSGFGKFLAFTAKILQNSTALSIILGIMVGKQIVGLIKGFSDAAKVLKSVAKFSIAEAVAKVVTSAASVPFVGWILAAGAGAAIGAMLHSYLADDMISPGYGKRVLTTPEGTFKLNDKDTVLAGTNLGGGRSNSNAGVIAAIANLNNTMAANKPAAGGGGGGNIYLDGERVGTMVGRRNETGTEQVKNSYRLA